MADRDLETINASGELINLQLRGSTSADNKALVQAEVDAKIEVVNTRVSAIANKTDFISVTQAVDLDTMESDIEDIKTGANAVPQMFLSDVTGSEPVWAEGQLFNADGGLNFQSKYPDVTLQVGKEQYIEVSNSTGTDIPNGSAVYFIGLSGGKPSVDLAMANLFSTASVLGITTMVIPNGGTGLVTTFGSIGDMHTDGFTPGATLYLSDTVPGGMTETAPDIASSIGTVLVSDLTTGTFFVKTNNIIALPTIYGQLSGGSTGGNISGIYQAIDTYSTHDNLAMATSLAAGTIYSPTIGKYKMSANISLTYNNIGNNKPLLTIGVYDGTAIVAEIPVTVTKDSEGFALFPSKLFSATAGTYYSLQIKSTTDLVNPVFDLMDFEIESTHIR